MSGDKVALVTGASRGIGRSIAVRLARDGFDVVINYLRNEDAAKQTLALVEKEGRRGWVACANVGEPDEVAAMMRSLGHLSRLDVLVHNAAIGTFKPLLDIRPNQIELAFKVNVCALLWLVKGALPLMGPGSKIVALSSVGGSRVVPNYGVVGPSKAALESLIRYLAVDLRPRGITVNAVSGGLVDTDALRAFPDWEKLAADAVAATPGGRLGGADEIASVVASLASGQLDWMCGQILRADGGATLR
ncbi:SDR family oxidoreductase [Pendulispora rubella]|uniref:SDR family oxidoreductase n=1 Tax=Pendulispora rubella TaxID=2741070 RepID=A0ABZ2L171_9BACT